MRFNERFRLGAPGGGRLVDDRDLAAALAECERANESAPITVFEMETAAALLLFAQRPADMLLLEVGLGGRLDATNVIDHPRATVIASAPAVRAASSSHGCAVGSPDAPTTTR